MIYQIINKETTNNQTLKRKAQTINNSEFLIQSRLQRFNGCTVANC